MGTHHKANIQLLIEMYVKKRPFDCAQGRFFLPKFLEAKGLSSNCPEPNMVHGLDIFLKIGNIAPLRFKKENQ